MKIGGVENDKSKAKNTYPVIRGDDVLLFIAAPVWSMDEFHKLCPKPGPQSVVFTPTGKRPNYECPQYLADVEAYNAKRWGYVILKTLEPSGIEDLGGVSLADPDTWGDAENALRAELSYYEYAGVLQLIEETNALDGAKLEENLQNFFSRQKAEAEEKKSPSRPEEPANS